MPIPFDDTKSLRNALSVVRADVDDLNKNITILKANNPTNLSIPTINSQTQTNKTVSESNNTTLNTLTGSTILAMSDQIIFNGTSITDLSTNLNDKIVDANALISINTGAIQTVSQSTSLNFAAINNILGSQYIDITALNISFGLVEKRVDAIDTSFLDISGRVDTIDTSINFFDTSFLDVYDKIGILDTSYGLLATGSHLDFSFVKEITVDGGSVNLGYQAGFFEQSNNSIAIGTHAGGDFQRPFSIAIGSGAGYFGQGQDSIAIGDSAAIFYQNQYSIAIGTLAGQTDQCFNSIAIGYKAGFVSQDPSCVAIGYGAGQTNQGTLSVAIGNEAGLTDQCFNSIAIGGGAGNSSQSSNSIAIGFQAGKTNQNQQSVAIGRDAGNTNQKVQSIAIGTEAGRNTQGQHSVAIGRSAGHVTQGQYSVSLGSSAGQTDQGVNSVAIGNQAGNSNQGVNSVAIGDMAAFQNQKEISVAVGIAAGYQNQNYSCVAVGEHSGQTDQCFNSVAIGSFAGSLYQKKCSVAIGAKSGYSNQEEYAIAIGYKAGQDDQSANSIILNAQTDTALNTDTSGLFIAPIRNVNNLTNSLYYDTSTKEIVYSDQNLSRFLFLTNDTIFDANSVPNVLQGYIIHPGSSLTISHWTASTVPVTSTSPQEYLTSYNANFDPSIYLVNGQKIYFPEVGIYSVSTNLSFVVNRPRITVGTNIKHTRVNSTTTTSNTGTFIMDNYVRNASSQDESTASMTKTVNITNAGLTGDFIEIVCTQMGNTGTANIHPGFAELYISKIASTTIPVVVPITSITALDIWNSPGRVHTDVPSTISYTVGSGMVQNTSINEYSVNIPSGWSGVNHQLYSNTTFSGKAFLLFRFRATHAIVGIYEAPSSGTDYQEHSLGSFFNHATLIQYQEGAYSGSNLLYNSPQNDDVLALWYYGTTIKYYRIRSGVVTNPRTITTVTSGVVVHLDSAWTSVGKIDHLYFAGDNPYPHIFT